MSNMPLQQNSSFCFDLSSCNYRDFSIKYSKFGIISQSSQWYDMNEISLDIGSQIRLEISILYFSDVNSIGIV